MIPMRLSLLPLLGLVVTTPFLAACGTVGANDAGAPRVVASFYPLQYVAERVAGDHAEVEALTTPGQEPHDLELTFKKSVEVAEADVVVYLSGFQPAVDDAVAQGDSEHVVDAAEVADLHPATESEEEHASHADGEEHESGDLDPHFWLDPTRLGSVAEAVEQQLAEADPGHADDYAANLAALEDDLTALDDELRAGLQDCRIDTVVVSHNAFAYFAERYGLHVESINGMTPDAEPSPAHLAQLSDLIESEGITTVFSETLATRELADTLAGDLGLETAVLDPLEGLADADSGEDYLSLMRGNLAALQEANDCS
jgi:zinc transport system substrate-binding protein